MKLFVIQITDNGDTYLHTKAYTDELYALSTACRLKSIWDECEYNVRAINVRHAGSFVYVVHTEQIREPGDFVCYRGYNGGIYANLKYAKKSSAWKQARSSTFVASKNNPFGVYDIDWCDTNGVMYNTSIYAIKVMKKAFFPKKVRKSSNLIKSGAVVGKQMVYHSDTRNYTHTAEVAEYNRRTVYISAYMVVQTDHGYAVISDGDIPYFICALPVDAEFRHIIQAIVNDSYNYGDTNVTIIEK